jgi:hypothetical protein
MVAGHDLRRLAVSAVCSDRSARRWYQDPDRVRETTRIRLEKAARELSLPLARSIVSSTNSPSGSPASSRTS